MSDRTKQADELFRRIATRPGMYLPSETFDCFVSYMDGFDMASDGAVLSGFHEWLLSRAKCPRNFVWFAVVLDIAFGDPRRVLSSADEHKFAIRRLQELYSAFRSEIT